MVKNTQKKTTQRKEKVPQKAISRAEYREIIRSKVCKNKEKSKVKPVFYDQMKELLNQATFQCPLCLETLLKPALAECGHVFCLSCIQKLVKHNYACGICHDFEPTYDLTVSSTIQELANIYLSKCPQEERSIYQQREKVLQENESNRSIGKLSVNDFVDFWCVDEKCWKAAYVKEISKSGSVILAESKGNKETQVNILSRRLARYRYFTKEDVVIIDESINVGVSSSGFNRSMTHPPVYNMGMPFYINIFDNPPAGFGGFDGNEFFGFMPRYRPFSFQ